MKKDNFIIAKVADFNSQPLCSYDEGKEIARKLFIPLYDKAIKDRRKLLIDLDDQFGYPTTVLEGMFLTFSLERNGIKHNVEYKSDDQPGLIKYIKDIIY